MSAPGIAAPVHPVKGNFTDNLYLLANLQRFVQGFVLYGSERMLDDL
jgi:hypothetical protein